MSCINSKIIATGSFLPEKIYTNEYLKTLVETSSEWIEERTGIKERHIASNSEYTSDLAFKAGLDAITSSNINIKDINMIIVATTTPDRTFPSVATIIQHKLGIGDHAFAFDVQAVCSGFVYALTVADSFIKSKKVKKALVIGADCNSKIVDWTDRNTCILFGDGAGAVILEATENEQEGILNTVLHSDGQFFDLLNTTHGICEGQKSGHITMQGKEIFKLAVNKMYDSVQECLNDINLTQEDIDLLIPHQANKRIIDSLAKKMGISEEKIIITVDKHGNTSAGSIPLAIDYANKHKKIKKGDLVVIESLGAGLTWGSIVIRWA